MILTRGAALWCLGVTGCVYGFLRNCSREFSVVNGSFCEDKVSIYFSYFNYLRVAKRFYVVYVPRLKYKLLLPVEIDSFESELLVTSVYCYISVFVGSLHTVSIFSYRRLFIVFLYDSKSLYDFRVGTNLFLSSVCDSVCLGSSFFRFSTLSAIWGLKLNSNVLNDFIDISWTPYSNISELPIIDLGTVFLVLPWYWTSKSLAAYSGFFLLYGSVNTSNLKNSWLVSSFYSSQVKSNKSF